MTETENSTVLSEEILGSLFLPKDNFLHEIDKQDIESILTAMNDTTLPAHLRKQEIAEQVFMARTFIAARRYKSQTPRERHNWYPGGDSQCGFLGWGETLEQVITEDAATLAASGMSTETIGMQLKQLLDEGKDPAGFSIKKTAYRGYQHCPFDACRSNDKMYEHAYLDFEIVNTRTNEGIVGPGLIWHLIARHGFFEGKLTMYRVDPVQLIKVLFDE